MQRYKRARQGCNSRRKSQCGGLRAELQTAGGQWGFGGGAPDAEAIYIVFFFSKNTHFLV